MSGRVCASLALVVLGPFVPAEVFAQAASPPSFRSGVDLVSVSAVARDRRRRLVRELTRDDFQVLDG